MASVFSFIHFPLLHRTAVLCRRYFLSISSGCFHMWKIVFIPTKLCFSVNSHCEVELFVCFSSYAALLTLFLIYELLSAK